MALFLARTNGYKVFLTAEGAVFSLGTGGERPTMLLKLAGGNPNPLVEPLGEQPGRVNYLTGSNPAGWKRHIPIFTKVAYRQVYPGIDLVFYGHDGRLEYDFVVAPGADPGLIRLRLDGAGRLALDESGHLTASTATGRMVQFSPEIYQDIEGERQPVEGRYILTETNEVRFQVASYAAERPLVIDPQVYYASYFGGNGQDDAASVVTDGDGNIYLGGRTGSTNLPVANYLQGTLNGTFDACVTKLDPTGATVLFCTYLGGAGDDGIYAIRPLATGGAAMTGTTASSDFPVTSASAYQTAYGGADDTFVAVLSSAGDALLYSTYLGGSSNDRPYGDLAVDETGKIYVGGWTASPAAPPGAFPLVDPLYSTGNCFLSKLDPSQSGAASMVFSTRFGGGGTEAIFGLDVDASHYVYIGGYTTSGSSTFPLLNAYQSTNNGGYDSFLAKISPDGQTLLYSTLFGGSGADQARCVAVDSAGNAFLPGYTDSSDTGPAPFPLLNPIQATYGGASDAFIAKFDSSGALVYSTYYGGTQYDRFEACYMDIHDRLHLAGWTESTDFPTMNPVQSYAGGTDAVLTVMDASDAVFFSTFYGGSESDQAWAVSTDEQSVAWLGGITISTDLPTVDAFQNANGGGSQDSFFARIGEAISPPTPAPTIMTHAFAPGSTAADFTIFSIGLQPTETNPLALLGPQIGTYDTARMRIGYWDQDIQGYQEYPFTEMDPAKPGDAAWFLFRDGKELTLSGTATATSTGPMGLTGYGYELSYGWVMVGNPFSFKIGVDDIVVTDDGGGHEFLTSASNTITQQVFWVYEDGTYVPADTLEIGQGGWIKKLTPGPGQIFFQDLPYVGDEAPDSAPRRTVPDALERPPAPPAGLDSSEASAGGGGCFIDDLRQQ